MKAYKYRLWKNDEDTFYEAIVIAENEEEAEEKISNTCVAEFNYDDYELDEEIECELVVM